MDAKLEVPQDESDNKSRCSGLHSKAEMYLGRNGLENLLFMKIK